MNKLITVTFSALILLSSCSPRIISVIKKTHSSNFNDSVFLYEINQTVNCNYEDLGTFKIDNTDLTKLSKYDKIINYAKSEARKIGGNAIKILDHTGPQAEMMGLGVAFTTSHNAVFKILKIFPDQPASKTQQNDSTLFGKSALYFYEQNNEFSSYYRPTGMESIAFSMGYGYQLLLDDSLIVKMGKNWKKSAFITQKKGNHIIKAKIKDGNFQIPLNLESGKDYYVRLRYSVSGKRYFEVVSNDLGEFEYSIADRKQ